MAKPNVTFYDETSERMLLGCMLNDNKCICDVMTKLESPMLYYPQHRIIYECIINLYRSGTNADIVSVTSDLMNKGLIDKAGGAAFVASLTDEVFTSANCDFYLNNVIKKAQSRSLRATLSAGLEKIGHEDNNEIIKSIENNVFRISAATTSTKIWTPEELATKFNEYLRYTEETWGEDKGIRVGFPTLDRMTGGFQDEDVIIIGARPSIGKTAIAITMMQNLMEQNIPFGFISAEMGQDQIMTRMISQRTRLDMGKIRSGQYTTEMKQKLFEATSYYASRKFYIDDTPNISLTKLISSARHMKLHYGVRIIFIDYIGLISVEGNAPIWEKVGDISKALKSLARELKIPIVALSQLGRDAEGNSPSISNIRGSGSVEQDADLVILLNGERDLSCYTNPNPILERDMTLAKHRNGPCGKIYLNFEKQFTTFTEDPNQEMRAENELLKNMSQKEREEYFARKNSSATNDIQHKGGQQ